MSVMKKLKLAAAVGALVVSSTAAYAKDVTIRVQ